jgi:ubiquinone/menaquinone biosynthesis C-methylase UbiE
MIEHDLKNDVKAFWDRSSCGEVYASGSSEIEYYESHSLKRFELEPYIRDFASFNEGRDRDVLEIGVGMGADHVEWAKSKPSTLSGIDLTPRSVEHTQKRLAIYGFVSDVRVGDAEALPYESNSFDLVYSWGVLHHSPDTPQAIQEVFRVLRPGGTARVMIYHKYALTGYMLWCKYALLTGRPYLSLDEVYHQFLESPGTKAYSIEDARMMIKGFSTVRIHTQLSFGDLLEGAAGQRHDGVLLNIARRIWPRNLIRLAFKKHGLLLLIDATK